MATRVEPARNFEVAIEGDTVQLRLWPAHGKFSLWYRLKVHDMIALQDALAKAVAIIQRNKR